MGSDDVGRRMDILLCLEHLYPQNGNRHIIHQRIIRVVIPHHWQAGPYPTRMMGLLASRKDGKLMVYFRREALPHQ